MRINYSMHHSAAPASQQGMVLIVGLVMVVLLTIIGIAAIRGSGLQENMAFNMRDKTVAFQSAESALRACESLLAPGSPPPVVNCVEGGGVCNDLNTDFTKSINNNSTYWLTVAKNMNEDLDLPDIPGVASQPTCLIEVIAADVGQCNFMMGNAVQIGASSPNCPSSYRVTSQAVGAESTTQIILQSTYAN